MLFGILHTLANRLRNFARLAQASANMPTAITHHHQGAETEAPTTLDHLGNAADLHHRLLKIPQL